MLGVKGSCASHGGRKFCSAGDCGSGGCGAREVEVGAMEAVSSFKHTEVLRKMNFIFAAVGSGGFGSREIEEEDEFLAPIYVLIFSLAYIRRSSYVRNFFFSFRLNV